MDFMLDVMMELFKAEKEEWQVRIHSIAGSRTRLPHLFDLLVLRILHEID